MSPPITFGSEEGLFQSIIREKFVAEDSRALW
jgi:hypothetical protein